MFDQRQSGFDRLKRRGGKINWYQNIADLQRGWRRLFRGFSADRDALRSCCHFHISITNIPEFVAQLVLLKAGHFLFSLGACWINLGQRQFNVRFPVFSDCALLRNSRNGCRFRLIGVFRSARRIVFDFHTVLALTSILHVFSNAAKLVLFGRHVQWRLLLLLAIPSIACVILGALLSSPADG